MSTRTNAEANDLIGQALPLLQQAKTADPEAEDKDALAAAIGNLEKLVAKNKQDSGRSDERAVWSTAFVNNLPDSSFLYIQGGGKKDGEGKTVPRTLRHFPYKDANGAIDMPHLRNALSRIPQATFLSQAQKDSLTAKAQQLLQNANGRSAEFPRENLIRGVFPGDLDLVERTDGEPGPEMVVEFARYNEWTEIRSRFEGHFLERIAPGAFTKTLRENVKGMRVLFQHGRDPQIGDKVLGPIRQVEDTATGPKAYVPLFDTSYNRDLEPGLRAGSYGSSFRFEVMKEEVNRNAEPSDSNPDGLPERTILEARVSEFGPVTFPAYEGATAGIRSLTDEFMFGRYAPGGEERDLEEPGDHSSETAEPADGHSADESANGREEPSHSQQASRDTPDPDARRETSDVEGDEMYDSIDEMRARQAEIKAELEEIASEYRGQLLPRDRQDHWDELDREWDDLAARIEAEEKRQERLRRFASQDDHRVDGSEKPDREFVRSGGMADSATRDRAPEDIFDMTEYHRRARDQAHMGRMIAEGAARALDRFGFSHPEAEPATVKKHVERMLRNDSLDREIAQRLLLFGSPTYRSAFFKSLLKQPLTQPEQAALAAGHNFEVSRALTTANTGGVTVPIQIDPTVIPTSNGVLNPIRRISRNIATTSYLWQGVTSAGVTATYRAEGATMADGTPTLVAPQIQPERADVFIPFSWEAGADWGGLEASLAELIQDAKDSVEATKFAVGAGHGSNEPQGLLIGAGTIVGSSAATAFSVTDVYALENALPPRYQPNASWVSHNAVYQKVRQFDTSGGADLWVQLAYDQPATLLGYPAYKSSTVGTTGANLTSGAVWGVIGDFSRYAVVDRVGLSIRMIDNLFGGTAAVHYPTGQSGLVAYWRNSAGVLDSNAFRVGTIT